MTSNGSNDDKSHLVGKKLNNYEIIQKIGAGGMGEVYLATDTKLNRKIAIKIIPEQYKSDEIAIKRFRREAKAIAALNHPNIITIYEVGDHDERPYFAMEYLKGKPLTEIIKSKTLKIPEVLDIIKQICSGLNEAHKNKIIHRDIKPANIIVGENGQVRILDFGLADVAGGSKITKSGSTLGTIGYMSPEQILGEKVDSRSDIFSLGVLFYEMVTGRRPFEGEFDAAIMNSILNDEPEPISRFKSGVPEGLQKIIDKAIEKDRNKRYQTVTEIPADLNRISSQESKKVSGKFNSKFIWSSFSVVTIVLLSMLLTYTGIINIPFLEFIKQDARKIKRIAVLPFVNRSSEDIEYISDGITEELISLLSRINDFAVVSSMSCFKYKNTPKTAAEVYNELKADYVLNGSIQMMYSNDGENLPKLIVQLVDIRRDVNIWSQSYDAFMNNIFSTQYNIIENISKILGVNLSEDNRDILSKKWTDNKQAYDYFLQSRQYTWRQGGYNSRLLKLGLEILDKSIALDSNYAIAYAEMSRIYSRLYYLGDKAKDTCAIKAESYALKALTLEPDLQYGRRALAEYYYRCKYDFERSLAELDLAYAGNYNNRDYLNDTHHILRRIGKWDEAYQNMKKVVELDAPTYAISRYDLALDCRYMRRYYEADSLLNEVIAIQPDFPQAYTEKTKMEIAWHGDVKKAREFIDTCKNKAVISNEMQWYIDELCFYLDIYEGNFNKVLSQISMPLYDSLSYYLNRGEIYFSMGDKSLSKSYYDSAFQIGLLQLANQQTENPYIQSLVSLAYAGSGQIEKAILAGKKAMELMPVSRNTIDGYPYAVNMLRTYVFANEIDSAFKQLDYCLSTPGDFGLGNVYVVPEYRILRDHPEFKTILTKYDKLAEDIIPSLK